MNQPQRDHPHPRRKWHKRQTPRGLWAVVETNDELGAEYQILVASQEAIVDEILAAREMLPKLYDSLLSQCRGCRRGFPVDSIGRHITDAKAGYYFLCTLSDTSRGVLAEARGES